MKTLNILVVEDRTDDFEAIKKHLKSLDLNGAVANIRREVDGNIALAALRKENFDLAIIDMCLPGLDGKSIIVNIRKKKPYLPILATSSFAGDLDEAALLNAGADDYISKPFSAETFMARVNKTLWHGNFSKPTKTLSWGSIKINVDTRSTTYRSKPVNLTEYEFSILYTLVRAQGHIVDANSLEMSTWGNVERFSARLSNKVKTLRDKLEKVGAPRGIIDTNRGMGYNLRQ